MKHRNFSVRTSAKLAALAVVMAAIVAPQPSAAAPPPAKRSAAPARAPTNAPLKFDCDVPEGRSSSVTISAGTAVRVSTRIVPGVRRGGRTPSNAGVSITGADGRNNVVVRMIVAKPEAAAFSLVLEGQSDAKPFSMALGEIPFNQPIEAIMEVGADGRGSVRIGANSAPLALVGAGVKSVTAFCAAGQYAFDPLVVASN